MINLIDEKYFDSIDKDANYAAYSRSDLFDDVVFGPPLKKYLMLTYYQDKFIGIDKMTLFYNRYYWFLKFSQLFEQTRGHDIGISQQADQILDEGDRLGNIDWNIIDTMSKSIKK